MRTILGGILAVLVLLGTGCSSGVGDSVPVESPGGILDLRGWNFTTAGNVIPQGWLWDSGVLWSPESGGRPGDLPPSQPLGPPDKGGCLGLQVSSATVRLRVLVDPDRNFGLRIGALPGAIRVWVNGVRVWESGAVSPVPDRFQADGRGTVLSVQPLGGVIEVVAQVVSFDPLVRHSELNRLWIVGPASSLLGDERGELVWRSLQAAILAVAILIFLWLSRLRPERGILVYFVAFLGACLAKLLVNVEQPEPLLSMLVPGISLSAYLFLNHGLNLLPFPLMILFLAKQFPEDVGMRSVRVAMFLTAVVTAWELFPFVALATGAEGIYQAVMGAQWSFILNLFVVLGTLFIFERFYQVFQRRRPLAKALFGGGIIIGLVVLLPIPLSYFMPVKYTYFLGWGLFLFLVVLSVELIRLQVQASNDDIRSLREKLDRRESLTRFLDPAWAAPLGRDSLEALGPGDFREKEAILIQVRCTGAEALWLPRVGPLAAARQALLVDWRDSVGTWFLDGWSEAGLSFALELQRALTPLSGTTSRIALTRGRLEFRIVEAGPRWLPSVAGIPFRRLDELHDLAQRYGARVLFDISLQDGLAIGGWKRHRHLTVSGADIELYENEEEPLALLKDKNLDAFENALALARSGDYDEALRQLFPVVQSNPFDFAARALLSEWGPRRSS